MNLKGAGRFLGNDQGSCRDCFPLWVNRSVQQSNPRAFILTITVQGQERGEDVVKWSTFPIIWHPEGGERELLLLGSLRYYWPSQVTRSLLQFCSNQMSISN